MEKLEKEYTSPIIGFVIMILVAFMSFNTSDADLPRITFFFAIGAVMFVAGYISISIKNLK